MNSLASQEGVSLNSWLLTTWAQTLLQLSKQEHSGENSEHPISSLLLDPHGCHRGTRSPKIAAVVYSGDREALGCPST